MIDAALLEVFQQPPMSSEPDVGTVEPFTVAELEAIARYNVASCGPEDCLDAPYGHRAIFTDHGAEHGHGAAITLIEAHFRWLRQWLEALDTLDADFRAASPYDSPSNAADRLLSHEARSLLRARDDVRYGALHYLIGDAGPQPDTIAGSITLSNGYITI